jgi:hypothetical protein
VPGDQIHLVVTDATVRRDDLDSASLQEGRRETLAEPA